MRSRCRPSRSRYSAGRKCPVAHCALADGLSVVLIVVLLGSTFPVSGRNELADYLKVLVGGRNQLWSRHTQAEVQVLKSISHPV